MFQHHQLRGTHACAPPLVRQHCRLLSTAAKRSSEMQKTPVVLPGEAQDPLEWVRNARDRASEAVVAPLPQRRRPQSDTPAESAAQPSGSSAEVSLSLEDAESVARDGAQQSSAVQSELGRTPARKRFKTLKELKTLLKPRQGFEGVLDACEEIWPAWAANGCRKLDLRGSQHGAVPGPRPAEAAAAMRVAAEKSLRQCSGSARLLQARDRRLLGLIEALSVTPARLPPSEQLQEQPDLDAAAEEAAPDAAGAGAGPSGEAGRRAAAGSAAPRLHPVLVTNALWSLGVMGGPVAFEAEMDALASGADLAHVDWRPRLAADVLWALALAHHWTPRLPDLEALLQRLGGLKALTAREAASALWAFATLGHVPAALLQDVEAAGCWRFAHEAWQRDKHEGLRAIGSMSSKALAATAWSLAAMEHINTAAFQDVWQEIGRRGMEGMGSEQKVLLQVHQVALAIKLEGDARHPEGEAAAELLTVAADVWAHSIRPMHREQESYHEGQIASALAGLGRFHVKQDVMSGYSVDLCLPDSRTVIEADGPSHLTRNTTRPARLLGHSVMKHRHLRLLGYQVVSVPWFEWDSLLGPPRKHEYLQQRIRGAEDTKA